LFDPANIDAALSEWDFSFIVTRRKPKVLGTVFMGNKSGTSHGWINIAVTYKAELFNQLRRFFIDVSTELTADFAFLHLVPNKQDLTITTHQLRQGLPDLYWLTLFGRPYVNLFGRERMLSVPNVVVEEPARDLFSIRLSEDVSDVVSRSDELFELAQQVKQHLNHNAFFDRTLGINHPYTVPEFHITQ